MYLKLHFLKTNRFDELQIDYLSKIEKADFVKVVIHVYNIQPTAKKHSFIFFATVRKAEKLIKMFKS